MLPGGLAGLGHPGSRSPPPWGDATGFPRFPPIRTSFATGVIAGRRLSFEILIFVNSECPSSPGGRMGPCSEGTSGEENLGMLPGDCNEAARSCQVVVSKLD